MHRPSAQRIAICSAFLSNLAIRQEQTVLHPCCPLQGRANLPLSLCGPAICSMGARPHATAQARAPWRGYHTA